MDYPAADWHICPCCGVEFNNDDAFTTHAELRMDWMANGAPWFSSATPKPGGWDYRKQLEDAGLELPNAG